MGEPAFHGWENRAQVPDSRRRVAGKGLVQKEALACHQVTLWCLGIASFLYISLLAILGHVYTTFSVLPGATLRYLPSCSTSASCIPIPKIQGDEIALKQLSHLHSQDTWGIPAEVQPPVPYLSIKLHDLSSDYCTVAYSPLLHLNYESSERRGKKRIQILD